MTEISKKSGFVLGKLDKKVAKLLKFKNIWFFFLENPGKKWLNDSNDQVVNFLGRPKVAHIEPYLNCYVHDQARSRTVQASPVSLFF